MSAKSSQRRTDHTKEIYGILFLAVGSFIGLCLYSYHPLDPSLSSVGSAQPIQNLGGAVGSYLADFLYMLLGIGAYFMPALLVIISFSFFALRPIRPAWFRAIAFLIITSLGAVLCQLIWNDIDILGQPLHAGGLIGWSLAKLSTHYLGLVGTYLFVFVGLLLTTVWLTEVSLAQIAKFGSMCLRVSSEKLMTWTRLVIARIGMAVHRQKERLISRLKSWREGRQQKRQIQINDTRVSADPEMAKLKELVRPKVSAKRETAVTASAEASAVAQESNGPAVFSRKDKKMGKRPGGQLKMVSVGGSFELPQLSYLDSGESDQPKQVDEKALKANANMLERKLKDFGVEGRVMAIHPGPVITMYEFEPAPGVKVNKIVNLSDDLSVSMGGRSVRVVPHLPGKAAIGIEIPNSERETVWMRDIMGHPKFLRSDSRLTMALGKDSQGTPMVADLAKMPHLLVAGSTGSGKSVSINTMICSILYKATPDEVRMILVDPKMLELSVYADIPHLLVPVVTDPKKANQALRWAVREMDRRYHLMAHAGIRDITAYNKKIADNSLDKDAVIQIGREELKHEGKLPSIVIIIDELADLMMVASKDLEDSIMRLAQKARASGIHLILATQRPSVDVITGVIKANFPTRISFKVSSRHDSRTILDQIGAERLLGAGDMLFSPPTASELIRVHGAFVTDTEIHRIAAHLKKQGKPVYREEILQAPPEEAAGSFGEDSEDDELYDRAVNLVCQSGQASISMVQRHLRIGYNRAARLIEKMESEGVVGPAVGSKPRQVLARNLAES